MGVREGDVMQPLCTSCSLKSGILLCSVPQLALFIPHCVYGHLFPYQHMQIQFILFMYYVIWITWIFHNLSNQYPVVEQLDHLTQRWNEQIFKHSPMFL